MLVNFLLTNFLEIVCIIEIQVLLSYGHPLVKEDSILLLIKNFFKHVGLDHTLHMVR